MQQQGKGIFSIMKDIKSSKVQNTAISAGTTKGQTIWQVIRRITVRACVLYTFFSLVIFLAVLILTGQTDQSTGYISSVRFYLTLLPYCICLALGHTVLDTHLHAFFRYVLHLILTVGGFYLLILLPYRLSPSGTSVTLLMVLFLLFYGILMGIRAIFRSRKRKLADSEKEYTAVFGGTQKKS